MNPLSSPPVADAISRREAIRRAAALLGVALSPPLLDQALRAQSTPSAGAPAATFTAAQAATVAAIAGRILPRTDTPGAGEVGVPAFIERMYREFLPPSDRALFAAGLAEIAAQSARAHRRDFTALTPAQQDDLLREAARAAQTKERTFFHVMRELTILGYFTAEEVQKKILHYDPIPGRWDACLPLAEVGNRAWAR
jgi:hypothetical protein